MIDFNTLTKHFYYADGNLFLREKLSKFSKMPLGYKLGTARKDGYLQVMVTGKFYLVHRLIWLYHYGVWPDNQLDHINGIRDDNRIENLREATNQQNMFNRKSVKGSSSQYKGVSWNKQLKKWSANYKINSEQVRLGVFSDEIDAANAYDKATVELHGSYHKKNLKGS